MDIIRKAYIINLKSIWMGWSVEPGVRLHFLSEYIHLKRKTKTYEIHVVVVETFWLHLESALLPPSEISYNLLKNMEAWCFWCSATVFIAIRYSLFLFYIFISLFKLSLKNITLYISINWCIKQLYEQIYG